MLQDQKFARLGVWVCFACVCAHHSDLAGLIVPLLESASRFGGLGWAVDLSQITFRIWHIIYLTCRKSPPQVAILYLTWRKSLF